MLQDEQSYLALCQGKGAGGKVGSGAGSGRCKVLSNAVKQRSRFLRNFHTLFKCSSLASHCNIELSSIMSDFRDLMPMFARNTGVGGAGIQGAGRRRGAPTLVRRISPGTSVRVRRCRCSLRPCRYAIAQPYNLSPRTRDYTLTFRSPYAVLFCPACLHVPCHSLHTSILRNVSGF